MFWDASVGALRWREPLSRLVPHLVSRLEIIEKFKERDVATQIHVETVPQTPLNASGTCLVLRRSDGLRKATCKSHAVTNVEGHAAGS